jgi:hypothetical protein
MRQLLFNLPILFSLSIANYKLFWPLINNVYYSLTNYVRSWSWVSCVLAERLALRSCRYSGVNAPNCCSRCFGRKDCFGYAFAYGTCYILGNLLSSFAPEQPTCPKRLVISTILPWQYRAETISLDLETVLFWTARRRTSENIKMGLSRGIEI